MVKNVPHTSPSALTEWDNSINKNKIEKKNNSNMNKAHSNEQSNTTPRMTSEMVKSA